MSPNRESQTPAPLEALFRADTVAFEMTEDEDDHSSFVMSLSRLAASLQPEMSPVETPQAIHHA